MMASVDNFHCVKFRWQLYFLVAFGLSVFQDIGKDVEVRTDEFGAFFGLF